MKVGLAAIAALSMALIPNVDAGQKGKKQFTSHGNVHIGSHVSSKNLKKLERQLKGEQKRAVSQELKNRQQSFEVRDRESSAEFVGRLLPTDDGADAIMNLWAAGNAYGSKKRHH